ncbi:unnamed protein product, partial [Medioppia subpectinata]
MTHNLGASNPSQPQSQIVIFPKYMQIPEPDIETIPDTSYIAMMVDVCTEPNGQILVYDEGSDQQLLSFSNFGTAYMCNHWEDNYESFVSDSNTLRVEYRLPRPFMGNLDEQYQKIDDDHAVGSRTVTADGGTSFKLEIQYFKIDFRETTERELHYINDADQRQDVYYIPNTVITYKLMPPPDTGSKNISVGVIVVITKLDIDEDAGDFVLVGPGSEPTHRELSKAQIITKNIDEETDKPRDLYVYADSAYIRLVTHNSLKTGTAMKFHWNESNTYIQPDDLWPEEKVPKRVKDSAVQVCVIDQSCSQFNTTYKESFISELVSIANDYLFNDKDHKNDNKDFKNLVSKQSVFLFNTEDNVHVHSGKSDISCQMEMAITSPIDQHWPMVSYSILNKLFFGGSSSREMHITDPKGKKYTVTDCSYESISFWRMILPIIVILLVSIALMLAAWRYQYYNWSKMQGSTAKNTKYMSAPGGQHQEDILFSKGGPKDNPIFVDVETSAVAKRDTTNNLPKMDTIGGQPLPAHHKPVTKQDSEESVTSYTSSLGKLPSVKESPEFSKGLFNATTSRAENEYVVEGRRGRDTTDGGMSGARSHDAIRELNRRSNTFHAPKTTDELIPPPPLVTIT